MTESQEYDVFLSHSSKDKPAVERIADRLRAEEGIQPFLDKWHLPPGAPWQEELKVALRSSAAGAVVIGKADLGRGNAAGGAVQKPCAKAGFQGGHMFRDGGFGNPHLLGCIGEAALVHYRGKGLHLCQSIHIVLLGTVTPVLLPTGFTGKSGRKVANERLIRGIVGDRSWHRNVGSSFSSARQRRNLRSHSARKGLRP